MGFIWGHAIVHFLSPVNTSSYGRHICLVLVSTVLLWVGRQGGFSSHTFTPLSDAAGICPLVYLFLPVVFQHLLYFPALTSHLCLICTVSWGLCSVLEGPLIVRCLQHFWRGFQSCQGFYTRSHIIWIVCPIRYPWGYPLLSTGLRMSDRLSCGAFVVSWLFLSSMWWQGL